MGISSAIDNYIQLQKLKKALPKKLANLADKKKCSTIEELGIAVKQHRDKTIQSHKSKSDSIESHNSDHRGKNFKKFKEMPSMPHINAEYASKIISKAKNLKFI